MVRQCAMAVLGAYCTAYDCDAVERVVLEVGQLSTASVQASGATITLDVTATPDASSPTLRTRIASLRFEAAGSGHSFSDVQIGCTDLLVKQPQFGCNTASIAA